MDEKLIYSLWDRFDKSDAVELVYESGDGRLKLRKTETVREQIYNGCITATGVSGLMPAGNAAGRTGSTGASYNANAAAGASALATGTANTVSDSSDNQSAEDTAYVRSPLPGTFYRSASPNDEPYVMIGSKVKQGDVVGIVESMKMMNEIVAPADGTVAEILAENGSIVGYDDKLIRLS